MGTGNATLSPILIVLFFIGEKNILDTAGRDQPGSINRIIDIAEMIKATASVPRMFHLWDCLRLRRWRTAERYPSVLVSMVSRRIE